MSQALLGIAILIAVSACSNDGDQFALLRDIPIPDGAKDVKKLQLGASSKNQQLYFVVERKFPASDTLDQLNAHFLREKWFACKNGPGWKDGWDSFVDESTKPPQRVHRIVSFWVRPDRRAFAQVSGMYSSPASSSAPSNTDQKWLVLVQEDVDALSEATRLSVQCNREKST
jgi:hypothetical protein